MRRSALPPVLLAILLLIAGIGPARAALAPATPPSPVRTPGAVYLALGDSVAAGVGASLPSARGYPAIIAGYLNRVAGHHVDLVNLSVPGETTTSFVNGGQLDRALGVIRNARAAGQRVSPITLTLGGNDLLDAPAGAAARARALQTAATNLQSILTRLRQAAGAGAGAGDVEILVTNYYDPTGTDPNRPDSDAWWLAQLNAAIRQATDRANARLVDVAARFQGHTADWTWYPADIHPNNAGYEQIADLVWQATGYDRTPPSVRIERPAPGRLARPIPTIAVAASDNVGVAGVSLQIDGKPGPELLYLSALGAYATLWDTRGLAPGPHTIVAIATDAAGNVGTARLTVTVVPASVAPPQPTA